MLVFCLFCVYLYVCLFRQIMFILAVSTIYILSPVIVTIPGSEVIKLFTAEHEMYPANKC